MRKASATSTISKRTLRKGSINQNIKICNESPNIEKSEQKTSLTDENTVINNVETNDPCNSQVKQKQNTKENTETSVKSQLKWLILALAITFLLVVVFLLISFLIMKLLPTAALYNQSCTGRSCNDKYNLKCINTICQCSEDEYYRKECVSRKSYLQKCYNNCLDSLNLLCSNGICNCGSTRYWNGNICAPKKSYGEICTTNNQCSDNLMLICNSNICLCAPSRYEPLKRIFYLSQKRKQNHKHLTNLIKNNLKGMNITL